MLWYMDTHTHTHTRKTENTEILHAEEVHDLHSLPSIFPLLFSFIKWTDYIASSEKIIMNDELEMSQKEAFVA